MTDQEKLEHFKLKYLEVTLAYELWIQLGSRKRRKCQRIAKEISSTILAAVNEITMEEALEDFNNKEE